ncbi:HdeD family acid-resistance protein [Rhodalgimonas zhirmunskyi]|uniref:DUF308 domain-containing protein n=1 Tax=Rhodalgimonas zhirmunskyi TaxID=2964767 RepID=A0AAJ1X645_9RHOB|nr:DUF308 domain-containing protein [Rhodoalgimonas zhirmunskyi]MDQ2095888.1 DUF308 domain-containing protein [Rhodoalgimonas zhirmunskyi]
MKASTGLSIVGVLLILGGILALANPLAASLAVTTLVGFFFLLAGVIQAWAAFEGSAPGGRFWNGIWALLGVVAGVWLLANPLEGTVSLALMLGFVFLVTGVMRIALGLSMAGGGATRWMLVLSGVAGIVIGVLVFSDIAQAATQFLGLLLGIELLSQGIALILLGGIGRRGGF